MGGDGGVIANQRKFLRAVQDAKNDVEGEGKQARENLEERAYLCALTTQKLSNHIVACELGNLFNKESILEGLMDKSLPSHFSHIRGLRDIKDLILTENTNTSSGDSSRSKYMCPITRIEFNGLHPFVVIWKTGKVLSEKAIREVGISELQDEFGPFIADDIVYLLPDDETMIRNKSRLEKIRVSQKKDKKESKKRSLGNEQNTTTCDIDAHSSEATSHKNKKKISKAEAIVHHASKAVSEQTANSQVYKKLFHDNHEKDKHDRDLFMSVSGIRYTLR